MKLWLDDVRPAPEGWTWVKTVGEAQLALELDFYEECSLDHDLGASPADGIFARGGSPNGSGYDLVVWMIKTSRIPPKITIHSWSPTGAKRMSDALNDAGISCHYTPYQVPGTHLF